MTEPDDILVGGEFAEFRAAYAPVVHPAGTAAVRRTVRRRRRRTAVVTAAAVVLAVAIPVGANAALERRPDPSPAPAQTGTPSPSASTSPPAPTPSASPSTGGPASTAPDGRITRSQLLAARLDLPAWAPSAVCTAGPTRLAASYRKEGDVLLEKLAHGDVDGDGAVETVALLRCLIFQQGPSQVVALDRDADGRIVVLGQVTRSAKTAPGWLLDTQVTDRGTVRVEMADRSPGGGWSLDWSQRQWRGYRWSGTRFTQVDGPTSFAPNPHLTDLTVSAGNVAWSAPDADGARTGTIAVTVRNLGAVPADLVELHLRMQVGTVADGGDWSACRDGAPPKGPIVCRFGPLGPGAERTFRFGLRNTNSASGTGIAEVSPVGTDADPLLDQDHENNEDRYTYR
ncbi:hypothetical protein GA0070622_1241 [Micromonospora sediminicola]|uniref:CARDB protein n=1 Tax=Micromonospora sediminicola TaxID=946078 RepID=A0A1A9B5C9_9ACTN|nr:MULTISPECIES: hypothetical protein [Micromonospora]PGH41500.1 hypothetical protein COO58_27185 [Micromonospora sp. WMMA1996]SBT64271.1 hypothetical protein GA0070622_1241 [Micromonospora sediminicola]